MLLPIVLLLGAASTPVDAGVTTAKQDSASDYSEAVDEGKSTQPFVHNFHGSGQTMDRGVMLPHGRNTACMSIRAYVFSDGDHPELKYVTDCPNLDVPYQSKHAHGNGNDHTDNRTILKQTIYRTGSR
jgi:hypothetical protein